METLDRRDLLDPVVMLEKMVHLAFQDHRVRPEMTAIVDHLEPLVCSSQQLLISEVREMIEHFFQDHVDSRDCQERLETQERQEKTVKRDNRVRQDQQDNPEFVANEDSPANVVQSEHRELQDYVGRLVLRAMMGHRWVYVCELVGTVCNEDLYTIGFSGSGWHERSPRCTRHYRYAWSERTSWSSRRKGRTWFSWSSWT